MTPTLADRPWFAVLTCCPLWPITITVTGQCEAPPLTPQSPELANLQQAGSAPTELGAHLQRSSAQEGKIHDVFVILCRAKLPSGWRQNTHWQLKGILHTQPRLPALSHSLHCRPGGGGGTVGAGWETRARFNHR